MIGTVILVGAGPGDPGLLTQKGKWAISQAEVVVYDRLVSREILALIPEAAEAIHVGKEAGSHTMPQEQINQLLLEKALEGKRVVRLKGGDPFLFGRGGEELELLAEHGVPFQVVPGVTSAIAVPSYAGIPVTHRDFCSSVHILTGHAKAGSELHIDFDALTRIGGTLVFLMGVSAMPALCRGLINAGMDPQIPAAMVQNGTLSDQKSVISTLEHLPADAADIKSPAVLVVGHVCSLSNRMDWFGNLPLRQQTVIVTRPAGRSGTLSESLRKLGANVLDYPCIQTVPRTPNPALDAAIERLPQYRWLVFTSPFGPKVFFDRLTAAGKDSRALGHLRLAAIGPKTADALKPYGLQADLIPETYDSEHLAEAMAQVDGPVLLCRASHGSNALPELFASKGIACLDLPSYDTVYQNDDPAPVLQALQQPVLVTFTSASTVRGFVESLPGVDLTQALGCCIGKKTAAEAQKYGLKTVVAKEATIESLIECIKEVELWT